VTDINEARAGQGKSINFGKKQALEIYPILDCKLKLSVRFLYQYLQSNSASYMPSQRTIERHTGMTSKTIVAAKKYLSDHNMITIKKQPSKLGSQKDKDLITVNDSDKWTDIIWLNPRSGPVEKIHRGASGKIPSAASGKIPPIETRKEKEIETSRPKTTSALPPVAGKQNKKGLIAKLRAFNAITDMRPAKQKNEYLRPIMDLYDEAVILTFVEDAKKNGVRFGETHSYKKLQNCIDFFIESRNKK
jgi:hypothetical protein